jgi:dipeptidyl aminopeptidase/acylaminoacyl peptidase
VSACLPEWGPDGRLWWCDDTSDWWQLRVAPEPGVPGCCDGVPPVLDVPEEVGEPRWVSGGRRHGVAGDGRVVFAATAGGVDRVWVLDPATGERSPLPGPGFAHVEHLSVHGGSVALVAGGPTVPTSVWLVDLDAGTAVDLRAAELPLPAGAVSVPEPVTVPVGDAGDEVVHGLFHPPRSEVAVGPPGELPPLVVRIHGGPTAAARAELSTSVQFWTTRGFAVVEVNYRGSTGYGRRYRDRLLGNWGRTDVEDCLAMARGLAERGRVAAGRALIRGGSAGGFTTLAALCADGERVAGGAAPVLAGGCSLYGVTDLAAMAADTHKFESRYLDGLVAPLPGSEDVYADRSPLHNAASIASPVLLLQGALDPVVPLEQAHVLAGALERNGVPHALVVFPDEAHGFRSGANIVAALETELAFAGAVLGVTPADDLPPLDLTPPLP